ncbi:MAG: hypothetical protein HOP07_10345 [Bacteriovoracaceae bacterium]|nr:hypothetical protein [Bacteriovoracaceae bacterium]
MNDRRLDRELEERKITFVPMNKDISEFSDVLVGHRKHVRSTENNKVEKLDQYKLSGKIIIKNQKIMERKIIVISYDKKLGRLNIEQDGTFKFYVNFPEKVKPRCFYVDLLRQVSFDNFPLDEDWQIDKELGVVLVEQ